MKKCPFCAEEILSEAKICKHCGKNISETERVLGDPKGLPPAGDLFCIQKISAG